jgi:BON domain-containing protein
MAQSTIYKQRRLCPDGRVRALRIVALCVVAAGVIGQTPLPVPNEADGKMATEIEHRFSSDPTVNAQTIKIDVRDGVVTLRGRVRSEEASKRAETIAGNVKGVRKVRNLVSAGTAPDIDLPAERVPGKE